MDRLPAGPRARAHRMEAASNRAPLRRRSHTPNQPPLAAGSRRQERRRVLRGELLPETCRKPCRSQPARVLVDGAGSGASTSGRIPSACATAQRLDTVPASGIRIGSNVETLAAGRRSEGCEVIGGERRDRRHGWHHLGQRQHAFEALAGNHDRDGATDRETEVHGIAEQAAQRAARVFDLGLARARRIEPGAMDAGDRAGGIGDGGDQSRIAGRAAGAEIPIVAAGMEPRGRLAGCFGRASAFRGCPHQAGGLLQRENEEERARCVVKDRGHRKRAVRRITWRFAGWCFRHGSGRRRGHRHAARRARLSAGASEPDQFGRTGQCGWI